MRYRTVHACSRCGGPAPEKQCGPARCSKCRGICPGCNARQKIVGEAYCKFCRADRARARYHRKHPA